MPRVSQTELAQEAAWGRGGTEERGKEEIRCLRDKEQVLKCQETIKILKMALERQKAMLSFPHHL